MTNTDIPSTYGKECVGVARMVPVPKCAVIMLQMARPRVASIARSRRIVSGSFIDHTLVGPDTPTAPRPGCVRDTGPPADRQVYRSAIAR